MGTCTKTALAAAAVTTLLAATGGPTIALPLHEPAKVTRADNAAMPVRDYRRPSGVQLYFGFGAPFFAPYYPYQPYYAPRYYEPYRAPYYAPRYYEPYYAPRYYEPAPYSYEREPYRSDPTGRCPSGQQYRYPVGCVPI